MRRPHTMLVHFLCCCLAGLAQAQPAPPSGGGGPNPPRIEDFPPGVRLGYRAEQVRSRIPVLPVVMIARDPVTYVRLIAGWAPGGRYPVLYDDGSTRSGEQIARFVRAFEPTSIRVLPESTGWPEDAGDRRDVIEAALLAAWDAPDEQPRSSALIERFRELGYVPPGVVAASVDHHAWPGALALAAGRGLPLVWVEPTSEALVSGSMSREQAGLLAQQIEAGCERTRLLWRGLGDQIDAVALCLNTPARVAIEDGKHLATTDVLGRHSGHLSDGQTIEGENAPRWAWVSQLHGRESDSAYRAMCSLFLSPDSAWLFDGYPLEEPFTKYDLSIAADVLREGGMTVELADAPDAGAFAWRARAARPIKGGLVMVNTKGGADRFELSPGEARSGDVPHLREPTMVHFVHSWSAVRAGDRKTIAGAWFARGAHAYFGSVEEPFLQAFVPPRNVAQRLRVGMPWSSATRYDGDQPPWKLACFGDPLLTLADAPPRLGVTDDDSLPGTELAGEIQPALDAGEHERAARAMLIAGEDGRLVEHAKTLLSENRAAFTPAFGELCALAAFRENDAGVLAAALSVTPTARAEHLGILDAAWQSAFTRLRRTHDRAMVEVLATRLRPATRVRDARELADAVERHEGRRAKSKLIAKMISAAPESARNELAAALAQE